MKRSEPWPTTAENPPLRLHLEPKDRILFVRSGRILEGQVYEVSRASSRVIVEFPRRGRSSTTTNKLVKIKLDNYAHGVNFELIALFRPAIPPLSILPGSYVNHPDTSLWLEIDD